MRKLFPALLTTLLALAFGAQAQSTTGMSKADAKRYCQEQADKPGGTKETLQACMARVEKEGVKKDAPKK